METIGTLTRNQPTLVQYTILMRSDVMFGGVRIMRYYGGAVTPEQVATLTDGLKMNQEHQSGG